MPPQPCLKSPGFSFCFFPISLFGDLIIFHQSRVLKCFCIIFNQFIAFLKCLSQIFPIYLYLMHFELHSRFRQFHPGRGFSFCWCNFFPSSLKTTRSFFLFFAHHSSGPCFITGNLDPCAFLFSLLSDLPLQELRSPPYNPLPFDCFFQFPQVGLAYICLTPFLGACLPNVPSPLMTFYPFLPCFSVLLPPFFPDTLSHKFLPNRGRGKCFYCLIWTPFIYNLSLFFSLFLYSKLFIPLLFHHLHRNPNSFLPVLQFLSHCRQTLSFPLPLSPPC